MLDFLDSLVKTDDVLSFEVNVNTNGKKAIVLDLITEDIKSIDKYINQTWPKHFTTQIELPLRKFLPEPENNGLRHIWKYGSADLVVYRKGKPICVVEAGGSQHFEEKQSLNDRRKWKLCEINGIRCIGMMNGVMERLSKRRWRRLIGRFLFGLKS